MREKSEESEIHVSFRTRKINIWEMGVGNTQTTTCKYIVYVRYVFQSHMTRWTFHGLSWFVIIFYSFFSHEIWNIMAWNFMGATYFSPLIWKFATEIRLNVFSWPTSFVVLCHALNWNWSNKTFLSQHSSTPHHLIMLRVTSYLFLNTWI